MKGYRRIFPESRISDDAEYVVVAFFKDDDGDPYVKHRGTYDDCAAYAERNESDDNNESYYVAAVTGAAGFGVGDRARVLGSPSGAYNGLVGTVVAHDTGLTGDVTLSFTDGRTESFWGEDLSKA